MDTQCFTEFADVLEQLETQFYAQALAKFQASDFTAAGFSDVQVPIQQFTAIGSDEAAHAMVLEVSTKNGVRIVQDVWLMFYVANYSVPRCPTYHWMSI